MVLVYLLNQTIVISKGIPVFVVFVYHMSPSIVASLLIYTKAVARKCPLKQAFIKISKNSQENTCVGVFHKVIERVRWLFLSNGYEIEYLQ